MLLRAIDSSTNASKCTKNSAIHIKIFVSLYIHNMHDTPFNRGSTISTKNKNFSNEMKVKEKKKVNIVIE